MKNLAWIGSERSGPCDIFFMTPQCLALSPDDLFHELDDRWSREEGVRDLGFELSVSGCGCGCVL